MSKNIIPLLFGLITILFTLSSCGGNAHTDAESLIELGARHAIDRPQMFLPITSRGGTLASDLTPSEIVFDDQDLAIEQEAEAPELRGTRSIFSAAAQQAALRSKYTFYHNKTLDAFGLITLPSTNLTDCLTRCRDMERCGSVYLQYIGSLQLCTLHGLSYETAQFHDASSPFSRANSGTYVNHRRKVSQDPASRWRYTAQLSNRFDVNKGPVYVRAVFTDSTASDWFQISFPRGFSGDQVRLPNKPIEAVIIWSNTSDKIHLHSFRLSNYPPFEVNFSPTASVYGILPDDFALSKSCGLKPENNCSSVAVIPNANINKNSEQRLSSEDLARFSREYVW